MPTVYCPAAPILKRPALYAKRIASEQRITGTAFTSVLNFINDIDVINQITKTMFLLVFINKKTVRYEKDNHSADSRPHLWA